jgi:3-phosphoshikimate 1-carboxyvinyltransferase
MKISLTKYPKQLSGQVHLPSSKSESNRALIINALGANLDLDNLSEARDTQTMIRLLRQENKIWDVLDAGTTMRFCTAFLALHGTGQEITGTDRMKERPIGILVSALRDLGADIQYLDKEGYPPLRINKISRQLTKRLEVPGNISSQYISALLMIAPALPDGLELTLRGQVFSQPYIDMTLGLMKHFGVEHEINDRTISIKPQPYLPNQYRIESDWSGASYWYSFCALNPESKLELSGLRESSFQGDQAIARIAMHFGVTSTFHQDGVLLENNGNISSKADLVLDFRACPDLAQTVMVMAACLGKKLAMTGLESLKIKETDRVQAMKNELNKIGAQLIEENDKWMLIPGIVPSELPAIKTYEDHRMAMAFAPVCMLRNIQIEEPEVVAKSYPGFWEDLKRIGIETQ